MSKLLGFMSSLMVSASLLACGESAELGACPENAMAQEVTGRALVQGRCTTCHSTTRTGAERNGAPEDDNWDDLASVRSHAEEMYGEVKGGEMPPGAPLSASEQESLRVWLACGARDVQ